MISMGYAISLNPFFYKISFPTFRINPTVAKVEDATDPIRPNGTAISTNQLI